MKTLIKITIVILAIFIQTNKSIAQNVKGQNTVNKKEIILTEEEKEIFKERTLEKIKDFQEYLSFISDKSKRKSEKEINIELALSLFINNGKGVDMAVSSLNKPTRLVELPVYLNRLISLPYIKVVMRSVKSLTVSNWFRNGTDDYGNPVYEATATYYQEFIGYKGSFEKQTVVYKDLTKKTVKIEIRYTSDAYANDLKGKWVVKLGDISVEQTWRL